MEKNINKEPPLLLMILDGFGVGKPDKNNAIHLANPKFLNNLFEKCNYSLLKTSGEAVGLPEGQMGNSEVGHMTIGSGRVLYQDLVRINQAIEKDEIKSNKNFNNFIDSIKKGKCHIIGLLSDGGVHSHENHIIYFIDLLLKLNIKVNCHFFLDGRDTAPFSGIDSLRRVIELFGRSKNFEISTISGRYYGMDRDQNFDRTKIAFDAIFEGKGIKTNDFISSIKEQKISDEFISPIVNEKYNGFNENDGILTLNWRSDRMRQIVDAIGNPEFSEFKRNQYCKNILTITEYSEKIKKFTPVIFEKQSTNNTLGEIISNNELRQLRIAETEKYAHVTFFFDCCSKIPLKNYKEILIDSPSVRTYDLQPEMSALEVTNKIIEEIGNFDFCALNFANLDMVGHTGNIEAVIKAINTIDQSIERIVEAFDRVNGTIIITADHGNSEEMIDEKTGIMKTSHSLNPVPFCIVTKERKKFKLNNGTLADIAPTILYLLGIEKPNEMTGNNLIISH